MFLLANKMIQCCQGQTKDPDSAVSSSRQGADVGAVISNLKSVLKLISERVMNIPECKRSITQILNALLSEKGTDASVLLCILDVIKGWIEDDFTKPGTSVMSNSFLTLKEIVSFSHKLSQVDKQNFSQAVLEEWERKYLQLLYGLCSEANRQVTFWHSFGYFLSLLLLLFLLLLKMLLLL